MALPNTFSDPVHIGVIGGTGLSRLEHQGFTLVAEITVTTPWGEPSSPIVILTAPTTPPLPIAFLSRHGVHHSLTPSEVPNRANIAALRSLGVRSIIAFSAVGSLRENIPPRDFVLPDQIIDRTKGIRHSTFFGDSIVAHVPFADPFDAGLRQVIINAVASNTKQKLHETGTLVCMEGPAFSTRAESNLYRQWGGDVINMSAIPEAKLAREAEIAYAMVCMSTDYDCWKTDEKPVDVPTVMANMKANSEAANDMIATVLDTLADRDLHGQLILAKHLEGTSRFGCCTARNGMADEAVKKIEWLLPGFFA